MANAHFLSPTASPPQVNPSWLCYPVLMSVRSPLLSGSALFLTASQTHAVTQPHSACLFTISPLGPSAFCFFRFFLSPPHASLSALTSQQPMTGQRAVRQNPRVRTHLLNTLLSVTRHATWHLVLSHVNSLGRCCFVLELKLTELVSP